MKTILAAILLATTAATVTAEPRPKQIQYMCGSYEEVQLTVEKYGEHMVLATRAPDEKTVNLLYVNFETKTSSWLVHVLSTNEYCMLGIGKEVYIPDNSPLKQGVPVGIETIYK